MTRWCSRLPPVLQTNSQEWALTLMLPKQLQHPLYRVFSASLYRRRMIPMTSLSTCKMSLVISQARMGKFQISDLTAMFSNKKSGDGDSGEETGGLTDKLKGLVLISLSNLLYICSMTKEQIQDLRDRVTSLRRHL